MSFLSFHIRGSRHLWVIEKERKLLLAECKCLLRPCIAETREGEHQERGCGPGASSFPYCTVTLTLTGCVGGVHPFQKGVLHVDAFYHLCIQAKLHYTGQIILKLDVEFTPYPSSVF